MTNKITKTIQKIAFVAICIFVMMVTAGTLMYPFTSSPDTQYIEYMTSYIKFLLFFSTLVIGVGLVLTAMQVVFKKIYDKLFPKA
jgi:hypothetical protein